MKKALILASGGIDSLTVIALAIDQGYLPVILSFNYNQNNAIELQFLKKSLLQFADIVKKKWNTSLEHLVINLDFDLFKSSLIKKNQVKPDILLNQAASQEAINQNLSKNILNQELSNFDKIEKYSSIEELPENTKPSTYVPARNTIFASYALGVAESLNIYDIFLGIHKQDAPNYPDCSVEYVSQLKQLFNIASCNIVSLHAPLIDLNKTEIVAIGLKLGVNYDNTISCYDPVGNIECGICHSCLIKREAFLKNNINISKK